MALISRNKLAGDVLFIGVGLGGCRLVNSIQQLGYECYYINTAIGDFDALVDVDTDMTYPIPKSKGCDKNMALAYSMVADYISDIHNKIDSNYRKYKHIYFAFSLGGGTGAGSAPAIAEFFAQQYEGEKTVGLISILPSKSDNAISSDNALKCLKYIENSCPSITSKILLDNEQEDKFVINDAFAEQVDNLLSLPENNVQTSQVLKSADERETLGLLGTQGYIHIARISSPTQKSGEKEPYIINSLKYIPKPDVKNCTSIAVSISQKNVSDLNPENLYSYFGRPDGDVKAGFNSGDESYAYIFGTEFPTYLSKRYEDWLDMFEQEKTGVELKKASFNTKSRDFLSKPNKAVKTSNPFERVDKASNPFETKGRNVNLPQLKSNPF